MLCREEGINRINGEVFEFVNADFQKYVRKNLRLFKREMDISGKRVLDKKVVENVFED
jgi:hypothetical protein